MIKSMSFTGMISTFQPSIRPNLIVIYTINQFVRLIGFILFPLIFVA